MLNVLFVVLEILGTALGFVNDVRSRAGAPTVTTTDLTLDFILDERGRELNLEGHRRSDLIRFGRFTEALTTGLGKVMLLVELQFQIITSYIQFQLQL